MLSHNTIYFIIAVYYTFDLMKDWDFILIVSDSLVIQDN